MKFLKVLIFCASLIVAFPVVAAEKLTLLLDWYINPDHAPVIIAQQLGYFEREGLEVEIIEPSDPSAPPRLIAANQGDIAISYQPQLYQQIDEELPIMRIGTLVETPLNSLVVLKDGQIKQLNDLKGKKIGYSVSGFEDALLAAMLNTVGIAPNEVELINVNFSLSPALLSGQVDAVIGAYRNFELTQIRLEGHEGLAFYPEEHGVPIFDELIYIVHQQKVSDDRFKKFLKAIEDATIYLTNHSEEALEKFIAAKPDSLDDELNRTAWYDTLPRFAKRPAALDIGRYNRFAEFMKDSGLIKEIKPIESYAKQIY